MIVPEVVLVLVLTVSVVVAQSRRHTLSSRIRFLLPAVCSAAGAATLAGHVPRTAFEWAPLVVGILMAVGVGIMSGNGVRIWSQDGARRTQSTLLTATPLLLLALIECGILLAAHFAGARVGGSGSALVVMGIAFAVRTHVVHVRAGRRRVSVGTAQRCQTVPICIVRQHPRHAASA